MKIPFCNLFYVYNFEIYRDPHFRLLCGKPWMIIIGSVWMMFTEAKKTGKAEKVCVPKIDYYPCVFFRKKKNISVFWNLLKLSMHLMPFIKLFICTLLIVNIYPTNYLNLILLLYINLDQVLEQQKNVILHFTVKDTALFFLVSYLKYFALFIFFYITEWFWLFFHNIHFEGVQGNFCTHFLCQMKFDFPNENIVCINQRNVCLTKWFYVCSHVNKVIKFLGICFHMKGGFVGVLIYF